jgi:hypothetical protein
VESWRGGCFDSLTSEASAFQVALSAAVVLTKYRGLASYCNLAATSLLHTVTVLSENGNHSCVFRDRTREQHSV